MNKIVLSATAQNFQRCWVFYSDAQIETLLNNVLILWCSGNLAHLKVCSWTCQNLYSWPKILGLQEVWWFSAELGSLEVGTSSWRNHGTLLDVAVTRWTLFRRRDCMIRMTLKSLLLNFQHWWKWGLGSRLVLAGISFWDLSPVSLYIHLNKSRKIKHLCATLGCHGRAKLSPSPGLYWCFCRLGVQQTGVCWACVQQSFCLNVPLQQLFCRYAVVAVAAFYWALRCLLVFFVCLFGFYVSSSPPKTGT